MDLSSIKKLIQKKTGLCFEKTGESKLRQVITSRMNSTGCIRPVDYLSRLVGNDHEFTELINQLTVNETYFFREPEHIRLLSRSLIPALLNQKDSINILSAGCSTGAEPYSIVMALMDAFGEKITEKVSVTGVDIDTETLEKARKGIYYGHVFRSMAPRFKNIFFEAHGKGCHKINRSVKKAVSFQKLNLLADNYSASLPRMDIIFYRNVSIYFNAEDRRKIFTKLARLLEEDGYLIVSSTETYPHDFGILRLVEIKGNFLFQKSDVTQNRDITGDAFFKAQINPAVELNSNWPGIKWPGADAAEEDDAEGWAAESGFDETGDTTSVSRVIQETGNTTAIIEKRPDIGIPDALFEEAQFFFNSKSYEQALEITDRVLEARPGFLKALAMKSAILMHLDRTAEAEEAAMEATRADSLYLEGYLLAGLASKHLDNGDNALKMFKKAAFLMPDCWIAHYYMADLFTQKGDHSNATREYSNVIRLLEKEAPDDYGLMFFPVSFPKEQILHLCRHNLNKRS